MLLKNNGFSNHLKYLRVLNMFYDSTQNKLCRMLREKIFLISEKESFYNLSVQIRKAQMNSGNFSQSFTSKVSKYIIKKFNVLYSQ